MGDDVVDQRRIGDAGGIELFAGDRRADYRENTRADYRPDAKRSQRPRPEGLLQGVLRLCRVPDQFVDRLAGKQLAGQRASPRPSDLKPEQWNRPGNGVGLEI